MDYSANLWDLSSGLPQQLAPIDDTDFLTLLSKQLNPHSNLVQHQLTQQQAAHPSAQSLLQDVSPPLTEESASPSPPAQTGRGLSDLVQATASATAASKTGTPNSNDEMGKRKHYTVEDDDDDDSDLEGQPSHKNAKGM